MQSPGVKAIGHMHLIHSLARCKGKVSHILQVLCKTEMRLRTLRIKEVKGWHKVC